MVSASERQTLRGRVIRASVWTLLGYAGSQFLRLVSNLIMTRLLVPEMFGIMALAIVIMVGLQLLSDIGLQQGVIQSRRGHEPAYLNTVWTMQVLRGVWIWISTLLMSAILYLLGLYGFLPIGSVYSDPNLPFVLAVLSLTGLFNGFASIGFASGNRNLTYGRITIIELLSQSVGLIVMVIWSLVDKSIWALVFGTIISSLLRSILSHTLLLEGRCKLHWDRDAFREVFGFGKWIFISSILGYMGLNGDRLLLGAFTDSSTLGVYAIAFFIVGALQDAIGKIGVNVAFPAMSEVARDHCDKLSDIYYKFRFPLDSVSLFFAGLLFSAGHIIVSILYDDRYISAGWMVEILSVSLVASRYSLFSQCLLALGLPRLLVPMAVGRLVSIFSCMPLAFLVWGLSGAVWAVVFSFFVPVFISAYYMRSHKIFDFAKEVYVLPFLVIGYLVGKCIICISMLFQ